MSRRVRDEHPPGEDAVAAEGRRPASAGENSISERDPSGPGSREPDQHAAPAFGFDPSRKEPWRTLRLIVEVKVQGADFKTKDFRWGVERALNERDPLLDFNKYRSPDNKVQRGQIKIKSAQKVNSALGGSVEAE